MSENEKQNKKRVLTGIVLSDKMAKTVVVRVEHSKKHKKYHKTFRILKKYKAHDEKGEYHVGDKVMMEETRPYSRDKRWKVIKKI
ncbi:MAG: 30S ribosomal protein S17 [Patescibacteria group bacterium]